MEKILNKEHSLLKALWPALFLVGMGYAMIIIAYGMDGVISGVHDQFHDFRHVIGMPCH